MVAQYHRLNNANHILGGLNPKFQGEVKLHGLFWCRWKGRFHFPIMALYIKTVLVSHTIPLKTKEMSREFAFFFFDKSIPNLGEKVVTYIHQTYLP